MMPKLKSYTMNNESICSLVVDYNQNVEITVFNQKQLGTTYHYSLLNIYNLGVVVYIKHVIFIYPKEHNHAHVYHEGVVRKGANNVCSLIMKTLKMTWF